METTLGKIYTFLETLMEVHLLFQIKNGLDLALPHFIKNLQAVTESRLCPVLLTWSCGLGQIDKKVTFLFLGNGIIISFCLKHCVTAVYGLSL